ncbi:Tafazzin [Cladobotryum mycophilum]|uniref:Tafazzin family protein n=1 Tax=Cladobotryum mycophilum TaxID=491253 RepID=A0ABR0S9W9_9HYPO
MSGSATSSRPGLPWRLGSMAVMGSVGAISRGFLYAFNKVEITGLDNLLGVLDRRKSQPKERGLLTVCNHVAVVDDPLIWGILPLRYAIDVENLRWGLGAHDICFKNRLSSTFFTLGQVLPTHRLWHSPQGGLYQPTIAQAIKLLSYPGLAKIPAEPTFSTDGTDSFPSPAAYSSNRHAWVHVFPEACCHQSKDNGLRYFKWGISRLILESDPAPEFIPMFIHGTQDIMPEERGFPDRLFGRYRTAWKRLVEKSSDPEFLMTGPEAVQLRIEVAKAVRDEVQKLRLSLGFPAEKDDSAALAETWANEPNIKKFKSPVDGSLVNRR